MSKPRRSSFTTKKQPDHVLPLQLALAGLLVKLHPLNLDREPVYPYSSTFTAAVLHVVSREVFELSDPASFESLSREIDALVKAECKALRRRNRLLRTRGLTIPPIQQEAEEFHSWMEDFALEFEDSASGCSYLDHLEHEMQDRISDKMDEDIADTQEPFECKSPLALFLRSLIITLRKLSFEDTAHVSRQIAQWCGIKVLPTNSRNVLMLDRPNDTDSSRSTAIAQYQSAAASGDYSLAISSLKRFYDHKFPGTTKSQHAHGLLNLALFYHQTGGWDAARTAVEEAIRIARKDGDKGCLQHCMSLLHQISAISQPATSSARRAILSHLPQPASSNDELTMLLTALDLGEPLPQSLQRIHLALARHLQGESSWTAKTPLDLSAWHMAQARIWDDMGQVELAKVHEDLALEVESGFGQRLTVEIARAMRCWSSDHSLARLLSKDVVEGLSFAEYTLWAEAVWDILHRQAEMRDDKPAIGLIAALRPTPKPSLRDQLWRYHKTLETAPAHTILPDILKTLQSAQEIGAWRIHRLATIITANAVLKLDQGLGAKAAELVEGVMDGIMDDEEEIKALALLVLGKARVEIGLDSDLKLGSTHLQDALRLAKSLRFRKVAIEATSILTMLAVINGEASEWRVDADDAKLCSRIQQTAEIVKLVGVAVHKPKI